MFSSAHHQRHTSSWKRRINIWQRQRTLTTVIIFSLLLITVPSSLKANTLHLGSFSDIKEFKGTSLWPIITNAKSTLTCALPPKGWGYSLKIGEWKRIQRDVDNGDLDGLLLSILTPRRLEKQIPVAYLGNLDITLFYLKDFPPRWDHGVLAPDMKVGVGFASEVKIEQWQPNSNAIITAPHSPQMVRLLTRQRVNAIIALDGGLVERFLIEENTPYAKQKIDSWQEFMLLSKDFIHNHPHVVSAIKSCGKKIQGLHVVIPTNDANPGAH